VNPKSVSALPEPLPRYFRILTRCSCKPNQLRVYWEETYPELSAARQTLEEHFWQAYQKNHPTAGVYNGTICQLRDYQATESELVLRLGPIHFKTHLFTITKGKILSHSIPDGPQTGLGVSATILTADNRLLFMKRSQKVATAPGLFDAFGGHIDPNHHRKNGPENTPCPFHAILCELREELNLPPETIQQTKAIGLIENALTTQPEMIFSVRIAEKAEQVAEHATDAQDRSEYSHIIHIPNDAERIRKICLKYARDFSPSGLGALWLHYLSLTGE